MFKKLALETIFLTGGISLTANQKLLSVRFSKLTLADYSLLMDHSMQKSSKNLLQETLLKAVYTIVLSRFWIWKMLPVATHVCRKAFLLTKNTMEVIHLLNTILKTLGAFLLISTR